LSTSPFLNFAITSAHTFRNAMSSPLIS
jgi:hypothetical protein